MAVFKHIVYFVIFQAILKTARGFTLPLNSGILQTDPYNIQTESPFSEDIALNINNVYNTIETQHACKTFPKLLSVAIPDIDNCFKFVLGYGEECAMKYKQFSKLQFFQATESVARPNPFLFPTVMESHLPINEARPPIFFPTFAETCFPINEIARSPLSLPNLDESYYPINGISYPPVALPTAVETCFPINDIATPPFLLPTYIETCLPINEIVKPPVSPVLLPTVVEPCFPVTEKANPLPLSSVTPSTSGFRLPLQVTSSVTALDPLCCKTDLVKPNTCFTSPSPICFDNPFIAYFDPLTTPCCSNFDLSRTAETLELISPPPELLNLPVSVIPGTLVPDITTLIDPNINIVSPLSHSTLSLPLSVTSTIKDIPSMFFDNCSPITNIPLYTNIPLNSMCNEEFVPTPNVLPHPSIPLSVNFNEINSAISSFSIDDSISDSPSVIHQYLYPLIDSELSYYNCPIVPTSTPVCVSYRGFYQGSTNVPSLGMKLTSPLYRNCHTLKPLPVFTNPSAPVSTQLPFLPVSEFNSISNVLSNIDCLSMIDASAANAYRTSQIFDDSCVSSSMNSLSSVLSPPTSDLPLVSNCMAPTPNIPLQSNQLMFDDFSNCMSEFFCNSYKRSPNVSEIPESKDYLHSYFINTVNTTTEPSISKISSSDESNVKNLQQLIAIVEMLIDDKVDKNNLNEILSLLPDF